MTSSLADAAALGSGRDAAAQAPIGSRPLGRRLKICFIAETVHAGVGRHLVDAIRGLSERGHEVHLLYSPTRVDSEFLIAIERQRNVHCRAIPMPRAIGVADLQAMASIRRYVAANWPFDIIHGHSSKGGGYARLLRLCGFAPIVYTPHAFITMSPALNAPKRIVYRMIEAILARLSDRIVCGSQFEVQHARQLGIPDRRRIVIANGVEAAAAGTRDRIRQELGLGEKQIVVGFVGRMDEQKAPERLVAAACRLLPELPELRFVLIGDGPKRAGLEASLQQAGLDSRVLWLGAVQARRYMPAFDILALSSLYEGFAYVLIEALFAGLPIVSTPVGGTHETIAPGVNGTIVPDGSPGAIAAAVRALAVDPALRGAMAEASRSRAEHFSSGRMVDAMEDLYFAVRRERPQKNPERHPASMSAGD